MTTYKVGYFVGSLSSTSINRILSKALIRVAPDDLEFSEIPIGNLPLYSPDFDAAFPPAGQALKDAVAASDGAGAGGGAGTAAHRDQRQPRRGGACHDRRGRAGDVLGTLSDRARGRHPRRSPQHAGACAWTQAGDSAPRRDRN